MNYEGTSRVNQIKINIIIFNIKKKKYKITKVFLTKLINQRIRSKKIFLVKINNQI
jgi:hypothetical protein